jgi:hypothetical protein
MGRVGSGLFEKQTPPVVPGNAPSDSFSRALYSVTSKTNLLGSWKASVGLQDGALVVVGRQE